MAWEKKPDDDRPETSSAWWRALRHQVFLEAGNRCEVIRSGRRCNGRAEEMDHIKPVFLGGSHDRTNMQAICIICHKRKTSIEKNLKKQMLRAPRRHSTDNNR